MPLKKIDSLRLIEGAIRLSAHVLAKNKTQLASQLLGRLPANTNNDVDALRAGALGYTDTIWLEPVRQSLQAAGGPLTRTLDGHSGPVSAVALSADGRTVVSGSYDNSIKVWDVNSGDCLRTLDGHSNWVNAVALSADGRTVVSGSYDNSIKVWDLNSGDCLRTLGGHSSGVSAVALSADGRTVVSGSSDNSIKVWDLNSGDFLRTLDGHSSGVNTVALSADGRTVVSGCLDNAVKVWDVRNYALKASFVADAPLRAANLTNTDHIIAGDQGGQIHWLRLRIPNQ